MLRRKILAKGQAAPPAPAGPWHRPAPAGVPYHLLARNDRNRWWRPLVALLLIVALALMVLFVAGLVIFLGIAPLGGAGADSLGAVEQIKEALPLPYLVVNVVGLALLTPVVILAAWLVQRQRPGSLASVIGRFRWGWMLTCVGIAGLPYFLGKVAYVTAIALSGDLAPSGQEVDRLGWVGWEAFLPALIVIVVLVPFQAAAEEYVCRGWLLQAVGAYIKNPWPGIILAAAVFTALHFATDWPLVVFLLTQGLVMGWLTVRTGGLEAAIAYHVAHNVLGTLAASATGRLSDALTDETAPWQVVPSVIVQAGTFTVLVVWLARRRRIQSLSR